MVLCIIGILLLIAADRFLKIFMTAWLAQGPIKVIEGVVRFRYVENTGMAFGWLSGKTVLLSVITLIIILAMVYYLFFKKGHTALMKLSLVFIIAGGLGNLYDRVFVGYVVDYIEPLFVRFAVFNLADILVNVGCALLLIAVIFSDFGKKKQVEEQDDKKV